MCWFGNVRQLRIRFASDLQRLLQGALLTSGEDSEDERAELQSLPRHIAGRKCRCRSKPSSLVDSRSKWSGTGLEPAAGRASWDCLRGLMASRLSPWVRIVRMESGNSQIAFRTRCGEEIDARFSLSSPLPPPSRNSLHQPPRRLKAAARRCCDQSGGHITDFSNLLDLDIFR